MTEYDLRRAIYRYLLSSTTCKYKEIITQDLIVIIKEHCTFK